MRLAVDQTLIANGSSDSIANQFVAQRLSIQLEIRVLFQFFHRLEQYQTNVFKHHTNIHSLGCGGFHECPKKGVLRGTANRCRVTQNHPSHGYLDNYDFGLKPMVTWGSLISSPRKVRGNRFAAAQWRLIVLVKVVWRRWDHCHHMANSLNKRIAIYTGLSIHGCFPIFPIFPWMCFFLIWNIILKWMI